MLSRSGRSNPDGKLTQRFDVPVSEDLNERAIVAASKTGRPKAEFLRDLIEEALTNGCWFPLSDTAKRSLDVLSALHGEHPGSYLADLVEAELVHRFGMAQMVVQNTPARPSDEYPIKGGRP